MSKPLGGGIIGAGPVIQAIHLPYPLNSKRPAARPAHSWTSMLR
jgi:hypothetical protein